jgi:hypothetical protein
MYFTNLLTFRILKTLPISQPSHVKGSLIDRNTSYSTTCAALNEAAGFISLSNENQGVSTNRLLLYCVLLIMKSDIYYLEKLWYRQLVRWLLAGAPRRSNSARPR